ncbi:MAG: hypothetical protein WCF23_11610 [Candidatus Nitrosopolaris sp.]
MIVSELMLLSIDTNHTGLGTDIAVGATQAAVCFLLFDELVIKNES